MDREVVSPTRLVSVGTLQSEMQSRGGPVALPTGEVNTQQLHVTSHGCEGGAAVEGSLERDPVGSSPRVPIVDNSENRPAATGESEGTTATGVPEDMKPGDQDPECPETFPEEDEWRSPPRAQGSSEYHFGEERDIYIYIFSQGPRSLSTDH